MLIENLIRNFWLGKVKLWKAFWLVGAIGGIIIGNIIIFIEENIFSNSSENPMDLTFRSKILIMFWVIYSTVGIWRSAENYSGSTFLKTSTKIYIVANCLSTIYLLFFLSF